MSATLDRIHALSADLDTLLAQARTELEEAKEHVRELEAGIVEIESRMRRSAMQAHVARRDRVKMPEDNLVRLRK